MWEFSSETVYPGTTQQSSSGGSGEKPSLESQKQGIVSKTKGRRNRARSLSDTACCIQVLWNPPLDLNPPHVFVSCAAMTCYLASPISILINRKMQIRTRDILVGLKKGALR